MKHLRTLNVALNAAFWIGFALCIAGVYFTVLHWPYGSYIRSTGYIIMALTGAICPFVLRFQPKLAKIQLTLLYWGMALLFPVMNFKHALLQNGFSKTTYYGLVQLTLLMLLSSAGIYLYRLFTGEMKNGIPRKFAKMEPIELTGVELANYAGTYVNTQLPLEITITSCDSELIAQATEQKPFPLQAIGSDTFRYDKAKIAVAFHSNGQGLTLHQHGGEFLFKKV